MARGIRPRMFGFFVFLPWILVFVGEPASGQSTGACRTCPANCQEGDNICATVDGPPLDADPVTGGCATSVASDGEMHDDVWYTYTAEHTGALPANSCQETSYDATTGCPMSTGGEIACNDDGYGAVGASSVA